MNNAMKRLTGSGGATPALDGTTRGAIAALMNIGVGLLSTLVDISGEQLAYIYAAINPLLFVAFGILDHAQQQSTGVPPG